MGAVTKGVFKLSWLGVKVGAVGGTAYYLYEKDLFSNKNPSEVMKNIVAEIPKEVKDIPEQYIYPSLPTIPSVKTPEFDFAARWNLSVFSAFHFLAKLPEHTTNATTYVYESVKSLSAGPDECECDEKKEKE